MSDERQRFSRWFTAFPSTHVNAGQTVEVMPVSEHEADRVRLEAENARLRKALAAARQVDDAMVERFRLALSRATFVRPLPEEEAICAALRAALAPAADAISERNVVDYRLAYEGLRRLVVAKYPEGCGLDEIAETWGSGEGVDPQQLDAIQRVEQTRKEQTS